MNAQASNASSSSWNAAEVIYVSVSCKPWPCLLFQTATPMAPPQAPRDEWPPQPPPPPQPHPPQLVPQPVAQTVQPSHVQDFWFDINMYRLSMCCGYRCRSQAWQLTQRWCRMSYPQLTPVDLCGWVTSLRDNNRWWCQWELWIWDCQQSEPQHDVYHMSHVKNHVPI